MALDCSELKRDIFEEYFRKVSCCFGDFICRKILHFLCSYGLTETGPAATISPYGYNVPNSCGQVSNFSWHNIKCSLRNCDDEKCSSVGSRQHSAQSG